MKLKEYLTSKSIKLSDFSKKLNITAQYLWLIVNEKSRPGIELAQEIENFTEGKVKATSIRPPKLICCPNCRHKFEAVAERKKEKTSEK